LDEIKIFADRGISFVTFLEADAAQSFINRVQRDGMTVRHRKLKAGWGRQSTALVPAVRDAVLYSGASRNVYIGGLPDPDLHDKEDVWTVESIKSDFETFGEVEMVNRPSGMDCAFVNFAKISSAIRAVEEMNNGTGVGGSIMKRYEGKRVNYGKDRCANAPRITKNPSVPPSPAPMLPPPSPMYQRLSPQHSPTLLVPTVEAWTPVQRSISVGHASESLPLRKLSLEPRTASADIISVTEANGPVITSTGRAESRTPTGRYEVPHRRSRASTTGMWDAASRAGTLAANGISNGSPNANASAGRVVW